MKNGWLEHIDAIIQSHCVGGVFLYTEQERTDAQVKALESTATALTDASCRRIRGSEPNLRVGVERSQDD